MEKGQDPQDLVLIPTIILPHTPRNHQHIRDDVPMAQHHPLGQARRPARIRQEGKIFIRIEPPPSVPTRPARLAYARKVFEAHVRVALLAQQHHPVLRQPHHLGGLERGAQEGLLGDDGFGARVFEHEGELVGAVGRVGRGDDAAGVEGAEDAGGDVDVIEGVDGQDVALVPLPGIAEAFAEGHSGGFDGCVGVVARRGEGAVDY